MKTIGKDVRIWKVGDDVTVPFICGSGARSECHSGKLDPARLVGKQISRRCPDEYEQV